MNQEKIIALEQKIKKDCTNIAGIVVVKDNDTVYEKYFNDCNASSTIHVYSVTKSIISLLIGIAIDKGYINSVDQKVLDFFPDYKIKKREHTIQNITIKDIITMCAPYKYRFAPYFKYFSSDDFVTFSLNLLGGKATIGEFRYTPLIGPDILCGILTKSTGQSVFDFATKNLFQPLGITVAKTITFDTVKQQQDFNKATNISGWVVDASGNNTAGWGLSLTTNDMAKIGQLCLNNGSWNEQQIVSTAWLHDMTCEHSRWNKINLPYGYLWWICEDGFAAMGDGGNTIYVNTKTNIVVAILSLFKPRVVDRLDFIKEYVEPIFNDE